MRGKVNNRRIGRPKARLGLPDLDQSKAAVIGSLRSPESQRGYRHAIDESLPATPCRAGILNHDSLMAAIIASRCWRRWAAAPNATS